MTDNELLNLINVIQTSKAEFQTVEVKRAEKSAPDKLYDTLSSFSYRPNTIVPPLFWFENEDRVSYNLSGALFSALLTSTV